MSDYRKESLRALLAPIQWHDSTSIEFRKEVVTRRREDVRLVLPFLNDEESQQAREWLQRERHEGLWE